MGRVVDDATLTAFVGESEASCLFDEGAVFDAYGAKKDDLLVIDATGSIVYHTSVAEAPLDDAANVSQLDGWVRQLVPL